MPKAGNENSSSSQAVFSTLSWVRKHGFTPIPLVHGAKAAAVQGYTEPTWDGVSDDFWLKGDYGIGVVLGPKRTGPIDIDLDCDEAIALAPLLLPATDAIFGRPGKPHSHYIYRPTEEAWDTSKFKDDITNTNILEIRSDGGNQTVFPGSIHETTKELIEWATHDDPDPSPVSREDLLRACRLLSIGVIVIRHIWSDGFRNDPTLPLAGVLAKFGWTREEAHLLFDAMAEVEDKEDKARTKTINITYNRFEEGKPVAGIPKLRELMGSSGQAAVDALLSVLGLKSVQKLEEYNSKFACVMLGGQRIFLAGVPPTKTPEPLDKAAFIDWHAHDIYIDDEGKPKKWAVNWLNSSQRRMYPNGLDFLPGVDTEDDGKFHGIFNLWNGWAFPIPDEKPKGSCKAWLELVRDVICGGDEAKFQWVVTWLAQIIVDPLNLPRTALVLKGEQGAGKSLMVDYFGQMLGDYYFVAQDEEHIVGRFTSHLARTLLLHSEEALFAGNHKHKGILKSLITSPFRTYEPKNVNAKQVRNLLRFVMSSNEARPAPIDQGDRRFTTIDVGDRKISGDLLKRILKEQSSGGPEALFWYLTREFEYDAEIVGKRLITEEGIDVMRSGFEPVQQWWDQKLNEGILFSYGFQWCGMPEDEPWPTTVSKQALYFDFLTFLNGARSDRQTDHRMPPGKFAMELRRLIGKDHIAKSRLTFNGMYDATKFDPEDPNFPALSKQLGDRQNAYMDFPTLIECRHKFEVLAGDGVEIKWPDPEEKRKHTGKTSTGKVISLRADKEKKY